MEARNRTIEGSTHAYCWEGTNLGRIRVRVIGGRTHISTLYWEIPSQRASRDGQWRMDAHEARRGTPSQTGVRNGHRRKGAHILLGNAKPDPPRLRGKRMTHTYGWGRTSRSGIGVRGMEDVYTRTFATYDGR